MCLVGVLGIIMNFNKIQNITQKLHEVTLLNAEEFDIKKAECANWVKEILSELEKNSAQQRYVYDIIYVCSLVDKSNKN